MNITIISGSHRTNAQSERVGTYIEKELQGLGQTTYHLSLAGNPLPLWDDSVWGETSALRDQWAPYSKKISESDGVVIIAPEWGGMVPAALKNFFLLCGNGELAHKPGLIIGVSSGISGSYPVAELRMSSYKNTRICYIPDHVIIRGVEDALVGEQAKDARDEATRARLAYSLKVLLEYTKALTAVRNSAVIDTKTYPFGM